MANEATLWMTLSLLLLQLPTDSGVGPEVPLNVKFSMNLRSLEFLYAFTG